jgi:hypothetical protein
MMIEAKPIDIPIKLMRVIALFLMKSRTAVLK